jgi:hypothetical protein
MICTAYRIVIADVMKGKKMGGSCGTYSGYRNKNGVYELTNIKGCGLDLSGLG